MKVFIIYIILSILPIFELYTNVNIDYLNDTCNIFKEFINSDTTQIKEIQLDSYFNITENNLGENYRINRIPDFSPSNPFPNPSSREVNIVYNFLGNFRYDLMQVNIFNINGLKITDNVEIIITSLDQYRGQIQLGLDKIQDGIYFIQMQMGKDVRFAKVIKMSNN